MGQSFSYQQSSYQQPNLEERSINKIIEGFSTIFQIHNKKQEETLQQLSQRLSTVEDNLKRLEQDFNQIKFKKINPTNSTNNSFMPQTSYGLNHTWNISQNTLPYSNNSSYNHVNTVRQPLPIVQPVMNPQKQVDCVEIIFVANNYENELEISLVGQLENNIKTSVEGMKLNFIVKKGTLEDCLLEKAQNIKHRLFILISTRKSDSREVNCNLFEIFGWACERLNAKQLGKDTYLLIKFQNYMIKSSGEYSDLVPVETVVTKSTVERMESQFLRSSQIMGYVEIPFSLSRKALHDNVLPNNLKEELKSLYSKFY